MKPLGGIYAWNNLISPFSKYNYTWKILNSKLCSFYGGTYEDIKFYNLATMMEFISEEMY